MADRGPQVSYPPRTSSRWPAPGIYVNVEFGVSFSQHDGPHTASLHYTSQNMEQRLQRQHQPPAILMAGYGQAAREVQPQQALYSQQQHQQRRLGIRPRQPHERGSSAPPSLEDRHVPIGRIGPPLHTGSFPLDERARLERLQRPLPPLPSSFRLGEPDLPWSMSTPTWAHPEDDYEVPTTLTMSETDTSRGEDPQRVRDLGALHQAMMTVDSLDDGGWDAWMRENDVGRGPRSLGWAISTDDLPRNSSSFTTAIVSPLSPPPPTYVASQFDEVYGGYYRPGRPRSSG